MRALPASLSPPSSWMPQALPASPSAGSGRHHRPCRQGAVTSWGVGKAGVNVIHRQEVGAVEVAGGSREGSDGTPGGPASRLAGVPMEFIRSVSSAVLLVGTDMGRSRGHLRSDGGGGRALCPPVRCYARGQESG